MMSAQLQQPSDPAASPPSGQASAIPKPSGPSDGVAAVPLVSRVAQSTSPYVRARANSPVAWQLLDDEAVNRARSENKLIFLSIGFLASHHCHLAHLESFSDPTLATLLNTEFIPILIDREEHPNFDYIYMNYNESLNSVGGWPLNVFLTPNLEPVFSGTYWAPPGATSNPASSVDDTDGAGRPLDWLTVVRKVHSSWKDEESRVREEAKQNCVDLAQVVSEGMVDHPGIVEPIQHNISAVDYTQELYGELDLEQIEEAFTRITRTFDYPFGGFGHQDKFLTPSKLSLMLRATHFPTEVQDVAGPKDCTFISDSALHTLRRIVHGAVHDHVGGGFHRHSVTRDWSLPSFEKMLIDNALLLGVFLDAWLLSGGDSEEELAQTVRELADYITSETIMSSGGGFFTSEAADSYNKRGDPAMGNGAFYLWTRKEFDTAVGDTDAEVAAAYWDVQADGNVDPVHDPLDEFLNQNVLRIAKTHASLSKQLGISAGEVKQRIASAREKLRAYREKERVRPVVDTKIVTAYNGMAIAALSRASAVLHDQDPERATKYLAAAEHAARFIKVHLWNRSEKVLYRVYCDGRFGIDGFAEDYAYLIEGLLELYEVTADESWLEWADELQAVQISRFYDEAPSTAANTNAKCGAFYSTTQDAPHTILRVKEGIDGSQPSVNSVSVSNLFRLGALLNDKKYTYLAKASVNAFSVEILEHPNLFPGLLCGIIPWRLGGRHWISVGENDLAKSLFHKAPRAALSTLRYHDPSHANSWLGKRDPNLKLQETGIYTQDNENPSGFRKIGANDTPWIHNPAATVEVTVTGPGDATSASDISKS
ncbi:duf255 domain-containing protein [Xylaria venustula]|nr:duf255 domain-containing protein [Xylaria venustula]